LSSIVKLLLFFQELSESLKFQQPNKNQQHQSSSSITIKANSTESKKNLLAETSTNYSNIDRNDLFDRELIEGLAPSKDPSQNRK
jgi:hypothetical protein